MLKYTLGALAAAVILVGAAFVILAQVTGGGADAGPARTIIVTATDDAIVPLGIEVEAGEIIDLQLNNQSKVSRSLLVVSQDVEQLPTAPGHDSGPPVEPGNVAIVAGGMLGDAAYVRFKKQGEYTLKVAYTGSYFPPDEIKVIAR